MEILSFFYKIGNNTDGKYFNVHNKLVSDLVYSPWHVSRFIEKTKEGRILEVANVKIVNFACGKNHTVRAKNMICVIEFFSF